MTPQKAIDFIENEVQIDVRFCSDEKVDETIEVFELAVSALEKQIPKKPYKRKEGKETNYYCSCKYYLGDETEIQLIAIRPRFCGNCGQKIDWSDTNG
ncbi:MAG: hypothetical protein ACI4J7_00295 [Ruminiclostridium sp.]